MPYIIPASATYLIEILVPGSHSSPGALEVKTSSIVLKRVEDEFQ